MDVDTTGAAPPAHADVLDLGHDVCLLPGLIDAHVHLAFNASADVMRGSPPLTTRSCWTRWRGPARQALQAGITTLRDLGARNFLELRLRDQLDASGHPGPHIIASGPRITIRARHRHFSVRIVPGTDAGVSPSKPHRVLTYGLARSAG